MRRGRTATVPRQGWCAVLHVDVRAVALSDYLNKDNPWVARFLGDAQFSRTRDKEQIDREYNQDKYGKLAAFLLPDAEAYKVAVKAPVRPMGA